MIEDQPAPIPNESEPIIDMVMADLVERKRVGISRYGVPLQAHNGRDMLVDLYQELMDAVIYIRGAIEERSSSVSYNEEQRRELLDFVRRLSNVDDVEPLMIEADRLVLKYAGLPIG